MKMVVIFVMRKDIAYFLLLITMRKLNTFYGTIQTLSSLYLLNVHEANIDDIYWKQLTKLF